LQSAIEPEQKRNAEKERGMANPKLDQRFNELHFSRAVENIIFKDPISYLGIK